MFCYLLIWHWYRQVATMQLNWEMSLKFSIEEIIETIDLRGR
jgi:hypothetical protein